MLKVEQADRDVAAAITGDEAMAYGMSDLSDAVQRVAKHREDTALPLREALRKAGDVIEAVLVCFVLHDSLNNLAHASLEEINALLSPDTTGGE